MEWTASIYFRDTMKKMTSEIQTYANHAEATDALIALCTQVRAQGRRPVVLVENYARQLSLCRTLAQRGAGFGVDVETIPNWAQDLWSLHGDGRSLISSEMRRAFAAAVLEEESHHLPKTPGTLDLFMQAVREALIYKDLPADLIGSEVDLVQLMSAYAQRLESINACEYCEILEGLTLTVWAISK